MKSGVVTSSVLHVAVLTWGLWSFSSPKPLDVSYSEALPVEIIMSENFEGVKGEKDAPVAEKPAPTPTQRPETLPMEAQNVGDNEADLETPPTPDKTRNVTPETSLPKPAAKPETPPAPDPVETATPPPEPPAPEPEPEPAAEPAPPEPEAPTETAAVIDPLAEMIATEEAKPEPQPEPKPQEAPQPKNVPTPQRKPTPPKPEPTRTAELTPRETPAEKPRKPATREAEPTETEEEVDLEALTAAAINRQKAAGGGAKRSTQQAALGSQRTTGATLSRGEKDAIIQQLQGCWNIPSGTVDGENLRASVRFNLDASGKLEGRPVVEQSSGSRVFDESAVRAIQKCDREGFDVPLDKAEEWAEVVINFDPSEMF